MARVKYSGIISSMNGKIGGTVFANSKYVPIAKNKPFGNKSRTLSQGQINFYMRKAQDLWQSFDDIRKNLWQSFADFAPVYPKNGQGSKLNGYALFIKYACSCYASLNEPVYDPVFAIPPCKLSFPYVALQDGDLRFYLGPVTDYIDYFILSSFSKAYPTGRYIAPSTARICLATHFVGDMASIGANYEKLYGSLPAPNTWIYWNVVLVSSLNPVFVQAQSGISFINSL